jgi:cytidylate kinase
MNFEADGGLVLHIWHSIYEKLARLKPAHLRYNISMIITIGGNLGAGKTTLAGRLSKTLNYEELYIGGIMREMAAEQRMSIEEFYKRLKHNPELERSVDERQAKLMKEKDNLIVQGRVAWFFGKNSPFKVFNIFLTVSPEVGAQRSRQRPENKEIESVEVMMTMDEVRVKLELERYRALYGIENFLDPAHYDFALDTTNLTVDEVERKVSSEIDKRK